jgi:hypothetical protein
MINFVVVPKVRRNVMAGSSQKCTFAPHGKILAARLFVGVVYKKYFQAGLTRIPNIGILIFFPNYCSKRGLYFGRKNHEMYHFDPISSAMSSAPRRKYGHTVKY